MPGRCHSLEFASSFHAAAVYEVLVLAVSQHRNVFLCGNLHGLFVEQRVHNGFSVLADRRDASFTMPSISASSSPLLSYCDVALPAKCTLIGENGLLLIVT